MTIVEFDYQQPPKIAEGFIQREVGYFCDKVENEATSMGKELKFELGTSR